MLESASFYTLQGFKYSHDCEDQLRSPNGQLKKRSHDCDAIDRQRAVRSRPDCSSCAVVVQDS